MFSEWDDDDLNLDEIFGKSQQQQQQQASQRENDLRLDDLASKFRINKTQQRPTKCKLEQPAVKIGSIYTHGRKIQRDEAPNAKKI